ncbi:MAG: BMP family ABC transporter substrate-binding protein [Phototrophicaceae bacterium]|jgi:basic membrane lipoprotein Med (substrate-binding protein (PBP1-ABC) superfamily)
MKRFVMAVSLVVALLALGLVPALAQESLIDSVCLVTDQGRVNDGTFNQFAYEGLVRAVDDFNLDSTYIETAAQTDYAPNIETCVNEGFDAVVTVGFLMTDATLAAATANPDVYFIGVDQFIIDGPANMIGTQSREDQMGYAVGVMAALLTESNVIGGVYGIEIPPVVKFRNGYEQGIRATNPDAEILGVYIDSFIAPERGAAAAEQFLGEGADVLFGGGGATGSGGIVFGAQQGIYVIGVDQDEYFTTFGAGETPGAEYIFTSAVKRIDNAVYNAIETLVNGGEGFTGGSIFVGDVTNGGVGIAPRNDASEEAVPEAIYEAGAAALQGMIDGTIVTGVDPATGALLPNIVDTAAAAGSFTTLLAAAEAAGLVDTLANGGPFTVFAPTDEAFTAALEALGLTAEELLADTETLTAILTYHVVPLSFEAHILVGYETVPTVQGGELAISVQDGVVYVNDAAVVTANIYASNGVIHVIDSVLLPE